MSFALNSRSVYGIYTLLRIQSAKIITMGRDVQCHVVTALIRNPVTKLAESVQKDVPDTGILHIVQVRPF